MLSLQMRLFNNVILLCALIFLNFEAFACTDFFINTGGFHIQGRTMDFSTNMATSSIFGYIGQKNTTDVIIDADKIPNEQLTSWTNRYGYFGRSAFQGFKIVDGLNTEGLAISVLTLPGSQYPQYDPSNLKPVLAIYDIPVYVLSQAKSVENAIRLITACQLVQSAVEEKKGIFLKDIGLHFVLRDKQGKSAVIEFINGKVQIYENAGNILTNAPSYDWHLKNAKHYTSLIANDPNRNKQFSEKIYQFDTVTQYATKAEANLVGMLGDFTAASRFARATVLLNNYPIPQSLQEALYQANSLLNLVAVPKLEGSKSATIWSTIKDLDNLIFYAKNIGTFQEDGNVYPESITSGYTLVDLKAVDFINIPQKYIHMTTQPTNPQNIKQIISANDIPLFSGN